MCNVTKTKYFYAGYVSFKVIDFWRHVHVGDHASNVNLMKIIGQFMWVETYSTLKVI